MSDDRWPPLPDGLPRNESVRTEWSKAAGKGLADLEIERRRQSLTRSAKRAENEAALDLLRRQNEIALDQLQITDDQALHRKNEEEMMDVAKASIERARDSAKYIQVAATAVGTLYTGFLALAFAADETALPLRGLLSPLFMGLAVALATAYLAFLTEPEGAPPFDPISGARANSQRRTDFFVVWVRGIAMNRAGLLRAGVVSFVIGVTLLPIALINLSGGSSASGSAQGSPAAQMTQVTRSPSPTPWPTPPMSSPIELAAVLYQAQLQDFVDSQDTGDAATTASSVDDFWPTVLIAVVGIALVVAFAAELLPPNAKQSKKDASNVRPRPTIE